MTWADATGFATIRPLGGTRKPQGAVMYFYYVIALAAAVVVASVWCSRRIDEATRLTGAAADILDRMAKRQATASQSEFSPESSHR